MDIWKVIYHDTECDDKEYVRFWVVTVEGLEIE